MLAGLQLRQYTNEEIKSLAVVRVTNPGTQDRGIPKLDGVTDPRMGLVDHTIRCPTCNKGSCDQHLGQIQLARPVYRLGTLGLVLMLLRCVCRQCAKAKFRVSAECPSECIQLSDAILGMRCGKERLRAISEGVRSKFVCPHCKAAQPNQVRRDRTFLDANQRPKDLSKESSEFQAWARERFLPDEALAILDNVPQEARKILGFEDTNPADLLMTLQIVPPPLIRPSNFVGESKVRSENDLTVALQDIVRVNNELDHAWSECPASIQNGTTTVFQGLSKAKATELMTLWDKLQIMTSGLVNHTIKKTIATRMGLLPVVTSTNKRKVIDIKTRLTGKKGRLRGNLSGKRVDQSGRSVISPDVSHDIYELGVPDCIMNKLTFPEHVTSWNASELAKCIVRGSFVPEGALAVRPPGSDSEHVIWLPVLDREARVDLASQIKPGYIVERHLKNGDWVLFNRQPSLWKASMMAFQAQRVKGLTFRLPLPVTRPFNADFDGDEMNIHALQTYSAMAEAQEIMAVPHQIVSPQSNAVLVGLVQDSLVGGYLITSQNTLFTEDESMQLLCQLHHNPHDLASYVSLSMPSKQSIRGFWLSNLGMPTVLKPRKMWTGKQIFSCLLPKGITFTKCVRNASDNVCGILKDDVVIVRDGVVMSGRLCKATLGTSTGGFVQSIWKQQGPWASAKFVSDAQRLLVRHLAHDTVCISITDAIQRDETMASVRDIVSEQYSKAQNILYLQVPPEVQEHRGSAVLQETLRRVGGKVIEDMNQQSGLSIVVTSGSKGNLMNIAQIAGCVGQQTVYGRRVPLRKTPFGTRTLATFGPNDLRPASRGFIANSYLKGLSPTEFFYHQMAGREGIVATAVSTADTGYSQRRMVKGQESQCVMQDGTVRVGNQSVVQVIYGGDDMDGSKLVRRSFEFVKELPSKTVSLEMARHVQRQILRAVAHRSQTLRTLDFTQSVPWTLKDHSNEDLLTETDLRDLEVCLVQMHAQLHSLPKIRRRPLVTALVLAQCLWFPVSKGTLNEIKTAQSNSLVLPGEGVGAVGSSSIGEPSMQLTLNVFHFSGIASKNVTISGLPRFKELINAADTSTTANMNAACQSEDVLSKVQYIYLRNVVEFSVERRSSWPRIVQTLLSWTFVKDLVSGHKRGRTTSPSEMSTWGLKMSVKWFGCHISRTSTTDIVQSLRKAFPEQAILADPHEFREAGKGPQIYMVQPSNFDDHSNKIAVQRLQELLQKDHAVQGLWNVRRAIAMQEPYFKLETQFVTSQRLSIDTEGSSLVEFASVPGIETSTVRTTNVIETCQVLGISAAVASLQAELHKTISFDSAYIDMRHTWLLADSMCRTGKVCAMNRHNMEDLGASLLQRASFEQSLDVFEEGASFGKSDTLSGATERIMVGQPVAIGTGLVHCIGESFDQNQAVAVKPVESHPDQGKKKIHRENSLITTNFQTRFQDQDRLCDDAFFLKAVVSWRAFAATDRVVPDIIFETSVHGNSFHILRQEAKNYGFWTSQDPLSQKLTVQYPDQVQKTTTLLGDSHEVFLETTVIQSKPGMPKVHRRVVEYAVEEDLPNHFEIRRVLQVPSSEVPASVDPTLCIMEQLETQYKSGFVFRLIRRWTSLDGLALDTLMNESSPSQIVQITFQQPESILQERVTDGQIANAVMDRMPM